jgi:hypothetical protein
MKNKNEQPGDDAITGWIHKTIENALAEGWHRPIVLILRPAVERDRQMWQDLAGEPPPQVPACIDPTEIAMPLVVQLEPVCDCLRKHCAVGGQLAALQLEDPSSPADGWVLMLGDDSIRGAAFQDGVRTVTLKERYVHDDDVPQALVGIMHDPGPSRLGLQTAEGDRVHVYGRTGADAAYAAMLVSIVRSGKWTLPVDGRKVELPMNDEAITQLLLRVFSMDDGPHQIAEAIRALRKLPGHKDEHLLELLRNRPELADLHRKVIFELTGEEIGC